jgi:hypothetical protein
MTGKAAFRYFRGSGLGGQDEEDSMLRVIIGALQDSVEMQALLPGHEKRPWICVKYVNGLLTTNRPRPAPMSRFVE